MPTDFSCKPFVYEFTAHPYLCTICLTVLNQTLLSSSTWFRSTVRQCIICLVLPKFSETIAFFALFLMLRQKRCTLEPYLKRANVSLSVKKCHHISFCRHGVIVWAILLYYRVLKHQPFSHFCSFHFLKEVMLAFCKASDINGKTRNRTYTSLSGMDPVFIGEITDVTKDGI